MLGVPRVEEEVSTDEDFDAFHDSDHRPEYVSEGNLSSRQAAQPVNLASRLSVAIRSSSTNTEQVYTSTTYVTWLRKYIFAGSPPLADTGGNGGGGGSPPLADTGGNGAILISTKHLEKKSKCQVMFCEAPWRPRICRNGGSNHT